MNGPVEVLFTSVRVQGGDEKPQPFKRPLEPTLENPQNRASFAHRQCPTCREALRDDEELAAVPLGPGTDREALRAQRRGKWFDAQAIVCHAGCLGVQRPQLGIAFRISATADTLRECAEAIEQRSRSAGLAAEFNPAGELFNVSRSLTSIGRSLSSWEEALP